MKSEPVGVKFWDAANHRYTILVEGGPWKGWLVYLHRNKEDWVTLRKATDIDRQLILTTVGDPAEGKEAGDDD